MTFHAFSGTSRYFTTFLGIVFFTLSVYGQNPEYAVLAIPDSLLENADMVVRKDIQEVIVESPRKYTHKHHYVYTVLTPAADKPVFHVWYDDFSKVKFIAGKVYDSTGALVRDLRKKDIEDYSYYDGVSIHSDTRYLLIDLKNQSYPYTVELIYERRFSETMHYPDWQPYGYGTSVELATLSVSMPESMQFLYENRNGKPDFTTIKNQDGMQFEWSLHNIKAIKKEPMSPPASIQFPYLILSPGAFEVATYSGSMKSWQQFGRFVYELNKGREVLTEEMRQKVHQLTANAGTTREKIEILYRYLQENMRYVSVQLGIGGWQSFDASYVYENKFGDCKALSHFMKGMLAETGIEAHTLLINNGRDVQLPETFASSTFNHMMVYVPAEDLWIECTSHLFPLGYIGESNADKQVLLLTDNGGKLLKTPNRSITESMVNAIDTIRFLPDGTVTYSGRENFKGAGHESLRFSVAYITPDKFREHFLETMPYAVSKVDRFEYSVSNSEDIASWNYSMVIPNLVSMTGKRVFVPALPSHKFVNPLISMSGRLTNIFRKNPLKREDKLFVELPPGMEVESLPEKVEMEDDVLGSFLFEAKVTDRGVEITRNLEIRSFQLPNKEAERVFNFFNAIEHAESKMIVLLKD